MVFRFAIFQLLGCFFLLFSFQGSFFFSLPSVVFYLAGLLVYVTISFLLCQHLFLTFLSALSAFFSAVCFDAASPTSMVCSIYHIFFSLSILFFSLSILFFSFSSFCSILTLYFKQVELQSKKYGDAFILQ